MMWKLCSRLMRRERVPNVAVVVVEEGSDGRLEEITEEGA